MNKSISDIWTALLTVDYISPKPSDRYGFQKPQALRADINPALDNQPWYAGNKFSVIDPTTGSIPDFRGQ